MLKKISIFSILLLISCGENETNKKNQVPEALQEKTIDIGRYRSNDDLTEELYQELVNKSPELKKLEADFEKLTTRDTLNIFYNYDRKSDDFYLSARNHGDLIKDSIMKNKILGLIQKSNVKYVEKTAKLHELIKAIHQKQNNINDYHIALKIILTIPIIEKYQNEQFPKKSPFEKIIEKENKLLVKTKTMTPKI